MSGGTFILLLNQGTAGPADPGLLSVGVGNDGTVAINVGTLSITGDSVFTIEVDPASNTTLAPGSQVTVKVRLNTDVAGTYSGTLRVPSSDKDGTLTVALLAVVLAPAAILPGMTVDPTGTVDFGSVDITSGTSVKVFTVTSSGTGPLICGTVAVTGTGYAKSSDGISGVTIPAGESRAVIVTLDPASIGTKTGTITFPATGVSSVVVNLTGLGTTGAPAPTPTNVTRFYLGRQASPVGALGEGPNWAIVTTDPDYLLATAKGGPAVSYGPYVAHTDISGTWSRVGRWVSPPLAAQTVDTSFVCYAIAYRSSALGSNVSSALRFGVRSAAGVMAWQPIRDLAPASGWPSSASPSPRRFPAGVPLSWRLAATFASGDRLVVELGYYVAISATGSARIRYGGASTATDLEATETPATVDLTKAPWISFTSGLLVLP